jgi:hypothetical protein
MGRGRPKKIVEVVVEVPTAPVVEEVIVEPSVVTRPTDDTVNDRIAPVLPSLNDPGQ